MKFINSLLTVTVVAKMLRSNVPLRVQSALLLTRVFVKRANLARMANVYQSLLTVTVVAKMAMTRPKVKKNGQTQTFL
ncbi:hypothetical protein DPMN_164773 [Dreissena polymorpha]|uniref:Uncharacterized protein n=1 Tax=Dreissena polymorpha TaxID=45954 RepID=A0A9D4IU04_DREPO|nr:hypothetical protein DPMN_164773 [Dreissena polymorpha]